MITIKEKVVLITGASRGIGRACAVRFAREGAYLVITARSEKDLHETSVLAGKEGIEILQVPADITDRDQVKAIVRKAKEKFGRIDILINSAGMGMRDSICDLNSEKLEYLFRVNLFAPLWFIQEVLPTMRAQNRGRIINISSVAGKRGFPFDGGYCASKFALNGLTESLRVELKNTNIKVILVCPSGTATSFFNRAIQSKPGRYKAPAGKLMKPEEVAEKILHASVTGKREVVIGLNAKVVVFLNRLNAGLLDWLLAKRFGIK